MVEREEESGHGAALIQTYRERFGEHIPLIRRQDVKASAGEDAGATVKLLRADLVVIVILVRRVLALQHQGRETGARQIGGGSQAVVSGADNNSIRFGG